MKLWRLSPRQHLLGLMAHHIVVDGWSMGLLLRELSRGYNAHRQGTAPALDPPPIQMVDYAAWQRRWYASAACSAALHYWQRQLTDLPVLELPTDLPRPAVRSDRGGQVNFTLDPELSRALEALAQARGVTPFMLLLAAFQCLLQRTSGQCDFAVGTPMANRTRAELEPMVGMLVNPVVLRADLSGDPSFDQLLVRVRDTVLAAYDHQLVPFDKLVETLRPQRDLSRNPLFQVMLSLQDIQQAELQLEGIDTRAVLLPAQRAKFDLTLELSRTAGGYAAWLEYSGDLFETESARALANRFQALLAALVEHPERAVSRSSALPPEDQAALLRAAGEGRGPLTHHQTLAGWFEAQAEQTPDATAVSWLDRRWTYRELDRLANRIAHRLIAEGVLPGQRVGLLMSRSLQAVAAILGVWKAGAAYVPLSPEEPAARRHRLIAEAAIRCVLCAQMPADAGSVAHMLVEDAFADAPDTRPAVRCDGDALAYVMFTSGSTGVPKGVEVPHRALVVRMEWEAFPWGADEVTCQKTGLGFVDSVWELFAPLVRGHRVVIADDGTVRDPQQLTALLTRERVTRLVLVPSLLAALLEGVPDLATRLPNLTSWSCTGEPLTAQLRTLFYEKLPGRRLLNLYGTTETWDALAEDVTVLPDPARITVGRALPYVRAYVLDGDTLAAPGVPGELCIGGHGLALRYHSGETSSPPRFGPDPFIPGGRLYRTGDRARVLRDGRIELLGRQDFQLKLRGVRIDPAEIEHALRRCGVRDALVVVRGEGPAAQLVAYLAADGDLAPDPGVLRATLREQLPASLVPSAFVPLPALPRNAAGKIDRAKLPDPSGAQGGHRAPRDPWELAVQQVWEQVLGEREIAVDASFFDVGGNSLLAAVCWRRICDLGGLERPLAWFFQRPTIAELAALLRDGGWRSPRSVVVPFRTTGPQPPLYLAHPAGGHVLGYLPLSRALGAQQPVFGLQSPRLYEPGDGHESVEAQAAHFARVLAEHHRGGPVVLGGWSFGGLLAIEMASRLGPLGVEVAAVILFDTWVPEGHSEREERSDAAIVRAYLEENGSQLGGELPEQGIAALVSQLHHAGALPNSLGEQELRRMLAIYRSNLRAAAAYRPVPVSVPVLQFVARERAGAPCQEPWRWQPLAARLDTVEAEGNHHTLLSAAHVAAVAREITARSRTGFAASAREGGAGGC
ncbi:MAG TPA: amino acid adenylation domain-containing protein [Kofleriaceae bacterium]